MAVSTLPRCLALVVCVLVTLASSATTSTRTTTTPSPTTDTADSSNGSATATKPVVDMKEGAMQMISDLRQFTNNARKGMTVSAISQYAQELEENAAELLQQIPKSADRCKTNLVIKMAAARIGSHEILTLLQTEDELGVLSGRLSLSLAFLESVTRLMEDELALSTDIGGHLAAIIFGTDMTDAIAQASDALLVMTTSNDNSAVKRQSQKPSASSTSKDDRKGFIFEPSLTENGGFAASGIINWPSRIGRTRVTFKPSLTKNGEFSASGILNWQSPSERILANVMPSLTKNGEFAASGSVTWKSPSGRTSLKVSPSFTQSGGLKVNGKLEWKSRNGKTTINVLPSSSESGDVNIMGKVSVTF